MRKTAAAFLFLLVLVTQLAFAQTLISTTKHNLSATGPGTVKSAAVGGGGTSEICVFCHTPHGGSPLAPLWNRTASAASYTLYGSDYLTSLGYPTPIQPNAKSKLCLSCHDGTMGLGTVLNKPGSETGTGTIPMVDGVTAITTMPTTAAGHLGTDLANDHPVGFLYQPGSAAGQDPDLVTRAWPWPTTTENRVTLDPNTSSGTVECHTCHEPHNRQFPKFLRMDNNNAAMCTQCHIKTGYAGLSSHAISLQRYTPTVLLAGVPTGDRPETSVGQFSCLGCHRPHTAPGKPLLRGVEEMTCYNAGCHGRENALAANITATTGFTWRNIQTEMEKISRHPTNTIANLHINRPGGELLAQIDNLNRHAECQDCHNPHQMQKAAVPEKSTRGALRVSLALKGVWGVEPTWPTPSTAMTTNLVTHVTPITYTRRADSTGNPVTDEYQVCLKCHSNYVTLPPAARNIAQEINPGNSSYHGMVPCPLLVTPTTPLWNTGCNPNYFVNITTMVQPWGGSTTTSPAFVANSGTLAAPSVNSTEWMRRNPTSVAATTAYAGRGRVWCSDCHGSNASTMPPASTAKSAPYGPHGSSNVGIAPGTSNSDRMLVRTITTDTGGSSLTPLCSGCHRLSSYASGNTGTRNGRHGAGGVSRYPQGCFTCHMWENPAVVAGGTGDIFPHGMNKKWAATIDTVVGSQQMVDTFLGGWFINNNYATRQCWPQSATCGNRAGTY